jgi:hypothetical protein
MSEWKLVPVDPTDEMLKAADDGDRAYTLRNFGDIQTVQQGPYDHWCAMLAAAPKPPHEVLTNEDANEIQNWKGMDGAIAYHLIERHANGWNDVGLMMRAWLVANGGTP